MTTSEVLLRPATPDDALEAAPLIRATGPVFFDLLFGPQPAPVLRLFTELFRGPVNPFSYHNAVVAERDGSVIGLAVSAPAVQRSREGWNMLWLLPRWRGPLALLRRLPYAWDVAACTASPPHGCYYLGILAVAEAARGQGVGSRLIEAVHQRGRDGGFASTALHVELDNLAAQRFYTRHGYREISRHPARVRLVRHGVAGLLTMQCLLAEKGV